MTETAIEFRNVVKRYGDAVAVAGIELSIAKGDWGKTASLRLIAGLELPTEGKYSSPAAMSAATLPRPAMWAWCFNPTLCFRT